MVKIIYAMPSQSLSYARPYRPMKDTFPKEFRQKIPLFGRGQVDHKGGPPPRFRVKVS